MRYYGITESPYSEELYHHGIKGQKWGVRRFQNPDGTRTEAGKERYNKGSERFDAFKKKVGKAVNTTSKTITRAAKAATKAVSSKVKKRIPSLMSDEELAEYTKRVIAEKNYKKAMAEMKANKFSGRTIAAIEDIANRSASKFADNVAQELAKKVTKSKSEKIIEEHNEVVAQRNLDIREMEDANLSDARLARKLRQEQRDYMDKYHRASNPATKKMYEENVKNIRKRLDRVENRLDDRKRQLEDMKALNEEQESTVWGQFLKIGGKGDNK